MRFSVHLGSIFGHRRNRATVFFGELAEQLWRGNFVRDTPAGPVSQAYASKMRLEKMLSHAATTRETYQTRLFNNHKFHDKDFKRALDEQETRNLHNEWMNDVAAWMISACLQEYTALIAEADELDARKRPKGESKGKKAKRR